MNGASDLLAAAVPGLLLFAAAVDLVSRRLPNSLCGVLLVVALLWQFLQGPLHIWDPLLAGIAVFLPLAWFWSRGWLGGGDVKLATALAVWAGLAGLPDFLLVTTLAGGAVAFGTLILPWFARRAVLVLASLSALGIRPAAGLAAGLASPPRGVPYGVALACGGLWIWFERFMTN